MTRSAAQEWPTRRLKFFDKSNAMHQFAEPLARLVVPCSGCPSETGQGTPAASRS